jgi:hypothetical protein
MSAHPGATLNIIGPRGAILNQTYLVLGIGLVLLGVIAASRGRQRPNASVPKGQKATSSLVGTIGMFFLGLGMVLVVISL